MSRYDKYEPKAGGFRAPLENDQAALDGEVGAADAPVGVALTADGHVVVLGDVAAATELVGVLCTVRDMVAGDVVDVQTSGEIVDFGGVPGTDYYVVPATGVITADAAAGANVRVGWTVEGDRLIVRTGR